MTDSTPNFPATPAAVTVADLGNIAQDLGVSAVDVLDE